MTAQDANDLRMVGLVILTCTFGPMGFGLIYCGWRLFTGRA